MKGYKYIIMVIILSLPIAAVFSDGFFIRTTGFLWGCLGWLVVTNFWLKQDGIEKDTLLQQHNREAEEMERAEKQKEEDPRKEITSALDEPPRKPISKNPFGR